MNISRRTFITGLAGALLIPHNCLADQDMSFGSNSLDGFGSQNWVDDLLDSKPAAPAPDIAKSYLPAQQQQYLPGEVPLRVLGSNEGQMFKFRDGLTYNHQMFEHLNWFLRCRGDHNATTLMDYRLIEHLNFISHWFGMKTINIHSGYRTPAYNRKLKERNRKVAPNSFHMAGRAIDFSVEGISIKEACSVALLFRNNQGFGGVGYYPGDKFIHIDTGPKREWVS